MFSRQNELSIAQTQYEKGLACEKTKPKNAIKLFKSAATSGHLQAACHLSSIYKDALNDALSDKYQLMADDAYDALVTSTLQNNAEAKISLSNCYQKGIYVKKNLDLAIMLCEEVLLQEPFNTSAIIQIMQAWKQKNWDKGLEFLYKHLDQHKMFDLVSQTSKTLMDPNFVSLLLEIQEGYQTGDISKACLYLEFALIKNTMLEKPVLSIQKLKVLADKALREQDYFNGMLYYHYLVMLNSNNQHAIDIVSDLISMNAEELVMLQTLMRSSFLLGKFEASIHYCEKLILLYVKLKFIKENILDIVSFNTHILICHTLLGNLAIAENLIPKLFRMPEEHIDKFANTILKDTSPENFPNMHNNLYALAQILLKQKHFMVSCRLLTLILDGKGGLLKTYQPGKQSPLFLKVIDSYLECTKNFQPKQTLPSKFLLFIKNQSLNTPIKKQKPAKKSELAEPKKAEAESVTKNSDHKKNNPALWIRLFKRTKTLEALETNFQRYKEMLAEKNSEPLPKIIKAVEEAIARFSLQKAQVSELSIASLTILAPATPIEENQKPEAIKENNLPFWKDKFLHKHAKDDQDLPVADRLTPILRKRAYSMGAAPSKESLSKAPPENIFKKKPQKYLEDIQDERAVIQPPVRRKRSNTMWAIPESANKGILPTYNREKYVTEATLFADKKRESDMAVSLYEKSVVHSQLPSDYYQLGMLYKNGCGVQQNIITAFKYFHAAALNGFPPAQVELAYIYLTGSDQIKIDFDEGIAWMMRASLLREPRARDWMEKFYFAYMNPPKALEYHQEEKSNSEIAPVLQKPMARTKTKQQWREKTIAPIVVQSTNEDKVDRPKTTQSPAPQQRFFNNKRAVEQEKREAQKNPEGHSLQAKK